jgi:hypothetical protein
VLYAEPGQFNPHAARADKRRRRRGEEPAPAPARPAPAGDEAYDFQADYAAGGAFEQLAGSANEGEMSE